jgi:hypothetical protein
LKVFKTINGDNKFGGVNMVLLAFFGNYREKRREKKIQRGICPDCLGRGFFYSGFESVHVNTVTLVWVQGTQSGILLNDFR